MIQSCHIDFTQKERKILEGENSVEFNDAMTLGSDHSNLAAYRVLLFLLFHFQAFYYVFWMKSPGKSAFFTFAQKRFFESPKFF